VREFLADHGIPFTSKDVVEDPGAMEELLQWTGGVRGTPVIVVDGEVIRGFDRGKLTRLLGLQ
jgi:glutaredoxin